MKLLACLSVITVGATTMFFGPATFAQRPGAKDTGAMLERLINNPIRSVDYDLCYPANSEEYEALGKNAVVMLTSSTAIGTELPLKSVYVLIKGIRVPLQRVAVFEKHEVAPTGKSDTTYFQQVSFYLLPIYVAKKDAVLYVDFTGPRTGFSVAHFSAKEMPKNVPSFVRLDEYDTPSDANMEAVARLLVREYPDHFPTGR